MKCLTGPATDISMGMPAAVHISVQKLSRALFPLDSLLRGEAPDTRDSIRRSKVSDGSLSLDCMCRDPDTKDAFSWSALSLFSPIDLRDMAVHDQDCWDMEKFSDAVFHISKLLQCFFHRDSLMPNKLQAEYASWRRTLLLERLKSFQAYILAPMMQRVHDDKILKTEARALFNALDTDQDGTVTKEVLAYWGAVGGVPMEKDELGMLVAELERSKPNHPNMGSLPVCSKNGVAFSPFDAAVTNDLMAQCDTAKEGVISFDQLYVVLIEALDRRESCSVI